MKLIGQEQVERLSEHHFTVAELSERWNLSREAVRKMFENEPGVAVFCHPKANKRKYRTLRIPESVVRRVYQRLYWSSGTCVVRKGTIFFCGASNPS